VKELNFGGIYVSPFVGDLLVAFLIYYLIRRFLIRGKLEGRVWHPQLFNLCLFLIVLSILALLD
jgi:hypothetical protein